MSDPRTTLGLHDSTKAEMAFIAAVHRVERRTRKVFAYVVIDRWNPDRWGRVVFTWTPGGRVECVAWLPGGWPNDPGLCQPFTGKGWSASAAIAGAKFWPAPDRPEQTIRDDGLDWRRQLEDHGFLVRVAV